MTEETSNYRDQVRAAFLGQAIGDALGVPVEFTSRNRLTLEPVTDFLGYRCWNQPPGTFSDDSSMMFCTAESLILGWNMEDLAQWFVRWYTEGYWGAHDKVFDIGGTTRYSLDRVIKGVNPAVSGEMAAESNGNGSLMRILPLVFFLADEPSLETKWDRVRQVSRITHGHFRSIMSCFLFVEFGIHVLKGATLDEAYARITRELPPFFERMEYNPKELALFGRILGGRIEAEPLDDIASSGYVLHSLEAVFWCFLNTTSYSDCVLQAVNLGGDTDTTAAIAGGLAGLYYGLDAIPTHWIQGVAKSEAILDLADRFAEHAKYSVQ